MRPAWTGLAAPVMENGRVLWCVRTAALLATPSACARQGLQRMLTAGALWSTHASKASVCSCRVMQTWCFRRVQRARSCVGILEEEICHNGEPMMLSP